jgi:hypothetical protein
MNTPLLTEQDQRLDSQRNRGRLIEKSPYVTLLFAGDAICMVYVPAPLGP